MDRLIAEDKSTAVYVPAAASLFATGFALPDLPDPDYPLGAGFLYREHIFANENSAWVDKGDMSEFVTPELSAIPEPVIEWPAGLATSKDLYIMAGKIDASIYAGKLMVDDIGAGLTWPPPPRLMFCCPQCLHESEIVIKLITEPSNPVANGGITGTQGE
jgi:hypothetical protein